MKCQSVYVFLNLLAVATAYHVFGRFAGQVFPSDIEFGKDKMVVTIHRSDKAQESFRETTNLHIFPTHVVAVRNLMDKHCYVYYFNESRDIMLGRVQNAEYNNGELNNLMEHRMILRDSNILAADRVRPRLGAAIAEFCEEHVVYLMRFKDVIRLHPEDIFAEGRPKRSAYTRIVAGFCDTCRAPQ